MTILKLLATATWTRIVTSRHLALHDRFATLSLSCPCVLCGSSSLVGVSKLFFLNVAFCLYILRLFPSRLLCWSLLWCLLHFRNTATHKNAHDAVIHIVDHGVKEFHTLEFEDEQRVFLFIRGILHTVFQFVEFA